jgi:chromosome segregation ATPase
MTVRGEIVANASALVFRARSFEDQRKDLFERIEVIKQRIESQKVEGGLLATLISRDNLPALEETQQQLANLRTAIELEKHQQSTLKNQTAHLQSSIEMTIAVRQKQAQYDKLATDARSLSLLLDEERQKESTLKFQQSQLSAEILRTQLNRKRYEQALSAEPEQPIDLPSLQKKKKSLIEQMTLVQTKREAFEQEVTESVDELERLRVRQQELREIADRSELINAAALRKQILEKAAENSDLRSYLPLSLDTEHLLEDLGQLVETSASLIGRSKLEVI